MQRSSEDRFCRPLFHNSPEIHHRNAIAEPPHNRQIVGDKQNRQPHLFPQVHQQIDDLSLNRDVQRRDALIGHDQPRLHGQRSGNTDALALAAA